MKKMTLLSAAVAALLFVGCGGDKPAEANTTDANVTVEANATEANATEATTEANATEANTTAVAPAAAVDGKTAYAACGACHGPDGKTAALGKSAVISGQTAADIETKLKEYKAGTRNVAGQGAVMQGQAANLNDDQIKALADYISKL